MKMEKKKFLTRVIAVCLSVLLAVPVMSMTCYAKTPTVTTKYEKLKVGKTQLKKKNYHKDSDTVMGKFVAPETGKYQISVTNNGEWDFYPKTLDEDLAVIESAKSSCDSNKTYTFKTISLKKNQVIYVYLEQNFTDSSLLAGKVTIKQQSATPSLSKTSATLKVKQKLTLKLKNNKDKVIWVSRDSKIASVNSKGVVQAKKKGTTYIYAIANNKLYICKVKVK